MAVDSAEAGEWVEDSGAAAVACPKEVGWAENLADEEDSAAMGEIP